MKCVDCAYWWQDEDEDRPCCHYNRDDGYAPCEVEEIIEEPEEEFEGDFDDYDLEMGFDPYMGCYSDDC